MFEPLAGKVFGVLSPDATPLLFAILRAMLHTCYRLSLKGGLAGCLGFGFIFRPRCFVVSACSALAVLLFCVSTPYTGLPSNVLQCAIKNVPGTLLILIFNIILYCPVTLRSAKLAASSAVVRTCRLA